MGHCFSDGLSIDLPFVGRVLAIPVFFPEVVVWGEDGHLDERSIACNARKYKERIVPVPQYTAQTESIANQALVFDDIGLHGEQTSKCALFKLDQVVSVGAAPFRENVEGRAFAFQSLFLTLLDHFQGLVAGLLISSLHEM